MVSKLSTQQATCAICCMKITAEQQSDSLHLTSMLQKLSKSGSIGSHYNGHGVGKSDMACLQSITAYPMGQRLH